MDQHGVFPVLAREFMEGRLSRRAFLRASAFLGMSGVAAAFLAACGSPAASPAASSGRQLPPPPPAPRRRPRPAWLRPRPRPPERRRADRLPSRAQGIAQLDPYTILFAWEEVLFPVLWDALTGYVPG